MANVFENKSDENSVQLLQTANSGLEMVFEGFAVSDCIVQADPQIEKYLRRVIRTALELAVYNRFGADVGGFWLMTPQIAQLRKLPDYYSSREAPIVARAVEMYLQAQLKELYQTQT